MADKRNVDDLSVDELERILTIKKREARQARLERMKRSGRVIDTGNTPPAAMPPVQNGTPPPQTETETNQSDASGLPAQTIQIPPESVTKLKVVPQFEDAIDRKEYAKRKNEAHNIWRIFVDRSLFLVEIAAVVGLFALGFAMFSGVENLQEETASFQATADARRRANLPTIAPTPQLRLANVVLPTGHTPPREGVTTFNFDEIPADLRGQVASEVFLPVDVARPQPKDDTPLRVIIPAIGVDHTIVQGVDWNALQQGVGQVLNGAAPSDPDSNVVLAAHNDVYGEIFRHLDQLEPGMQYQIQTQEGFFTYVVRESQVVEPDAVHVMESQGTPMSTLISCYPYQVNTHRIVIHADRVDA